MKTKIMIQLVIVLAVVLAALPPQASSLAATVTYDRDAAVDWAINNNRNDGKYYGDAEGRWCTTYITKALQAGGLPGITIINSNPGLAGWLKAHPDYWELKTYDQFSQLEKGDFIFLNKQSFDLNSIPIAHSVLVTGPGTGSGWNAERLNKPLSWWDTDAWPYQLGIHIKTGITPIKFVNGASTPSMTTTALNMTVTAGNLNGNTVSWGVYRPAFAGLPEEILRGELKATSNTATFTMLNTPIPGATYYTVVSLQSITDEDLRKQRDACYSLTGGVQLCDKSIALAATPSPTSSCTFCEPTRDQLISTTVREQIYWDRIYSGSVDALHYEMWPVYFSAQRTFTVTAVATSGDLVPLIVFNDKDGVEITRGQGSLSSTQPAGNYYVEIRPQSGSGTYTLKIIQGAIPTITIITPKPTETAISTPTPTLLPSLSASAVLSASNIEVGQTLDGSIHINNIPAEGLSSIEVACTMDGVQFSNITDAGRFGQDAVLAGGVAQGGNGFLVGLAGSNGSRAHTSGPVLRFTVMGVQPGQFSLDCAVRVSKGGNSLAELPFIASSLKVTEKTTPTPVTPTPEPVSTLSGAVTAGKPVTITITGQNGVASVITANPDGSFILEVEPGVYNIVAEAEGFMKAQGAVTIATGQLVTLPVISLIAGDINGDGEINGVDVIAIGANYGNANPTAADLNNDGVINVLDLEILAGNYRLAGPAEWK